MEQMKWLEKALDTKSGRPICTTVFRDISSLVATNGHRLHRVTGLDTIEKPHAIDGSDTQMPDFNHVVPTSRPLGEAMIWLEKEHLAELKSMMTFIYSQGKKKSMALKVKATKTTLQLIYSGQGKFGQFEINNANLSDQIEWSLHIEAKYLYDALSGSQFTKWRPHEVINLKFFGELNALLIENKDRKQEAVIMPLRIDN